MSEEDEGVSLTQAAPAVLQQFLFGVRDFFRSLFAAISVVRSSSKVRVIIYRCFVLNGIIITLGMFLFGHFVRPVIQYMYGSLYVLLIGGDVDKFSSSLIHTVDMTFDVLWIVPLYWVSKPINSIWFQEIADLLFKKTDSSLRRTSTKKDSMPSGLIADFLFSVLAEFIFLLQATFILYLPYIGYILCVFLLSVLYALYAFEYKWFGQGVSIQERIYRVEKNWPYYAGFGMVLCMLTLYPSSATISAAFFSLFFPVMIIGVHTTKPVLPPICIPQLPLFILALRTATYVSELLIYRVLKVRKIKKAT
ncbi:etoposide-induced protein 2.4 homolog [Dysidea avara]|uniref:etoposide-induced protein 2.4 homolog n=1 Tax=Dysidea avara TaxID=196820 RepID=UPI00332CF15A